MISIDVKQRLEKKGLVGRPLKTLGTPTKCTYVCS